MKITIDSEAGTLQVENGNEARSLDMYGKDAFELISDAITLDKYVSIGIKLMAVSCPSRLMILSFPLKVWTVSRSQ